MHLTGRACRSLIAVALLLAAMGCSSSPPPASATTLKSGPATQSGSITEIHPILYHRTGGLAGTDDRVVIWPDRHVEVSGKLLGGGSGRIAQERLTHLVAMFAGWRSLDDQYLSSAGADAYTITIYYGGKAVEASDLAPDLPPQFRAIFTEIESIAAQATINDTKLAP